MADLQRIAEFFPTPGFEFALDPTFEPERAPGDSDRGVPPPNKENTAKFAILQKYNRVIYSRRLHRHHVRQAGSAGEVLILYAKGLGPTTPSVNPGDPYPGAPLAIVNSPVDVLANGKSSPVINQIGLPGTRDIYHVAFRVPNDITAGPARVQISAAWVKGSAVAMPVR